MSRKLITGLAMVGGLLIVIVVVVAFSFPSGSVATDEDGTITLELAMLVVPVADAEPILEAPDQFLGVPHPRPRFDTVDFGPDLSFRQDIDDLEPLDPEKVLRAVYLGHNESGKPYHIWHVGSPDLRRLLGQIVADFGSFGRLGSSYGTLATGGGLFNNPRRELIDEVGLTTGSLSYGSDTPATLVAEWHGLPTDVAVVVFYRDGEPLGWQNPVSGTAALQVISDEDAELFDFDVEMVALTADGEEWNRYP